MSYADLSVLPSNAQQEVLDYYQFLIEKHAKKPKSPIKSDEQTKQSHFDDLFGILTANRSVSLEEMEEAQHNRDWSVLMIAIDTNVLVRVLINDPTAQQQCQLARDLIVMFG
jgi:hypothetical protein